jgi:hypothetical protein
MVKFLDIIHDPGAPPQNKWNPQILLRPLLLENN